MEHRVYWWVRPTYAKLRVRQIFMSVQNELKYDTVSSLHSASFNIRAYGLVVLCVLGLHARYIENPVRSPGNGYNRMMKGMHLHANAWKCSRPTYSAYVECFCAKCRRNYIVIYAKERIVGGFASESPAGALPLNFALGSAPSLPSPRAISGSAMLLALVVKSAHF